MKLTTVLICICFTFSAHSQVDTINTNNRKLNMAAFKQGKSSYAVFFADSTGKRNSSADIWDREIILNNSGFTFKWEMFRKDTSILQVEATGELPSLKMTSHKANHYTRGIFHYEFNNGVVTVADYARRNARDSAFKVMLDPAGFQFPMDLEIFPLLPFQKIGQQFAIAFYEPGSPSSKYYLLTVTGKEDLPTVGGQKVNCWTMRIDYRPGAYADFWISDNTREVLKMKEWFGRGYRYKVRLF